MAETPRIEIIEDPRFQEHRAPRGHPECPERLLAIGKALADSPFPLTAAAPRAATPDEILEVHESQLLATVEAAAARAPTHLDADTYVSPQSFHTALLAAGSCIDLSLRVARGDADYGIAAVRPPGHHAEHDRAMGFCLFNNVAIAARALQRQAGVDELMIVDWDVHHGNGTQHSFEDDPSILYVSTHQFPHYPGTGRASENGRGRGEGATLNIPMPAGCGDAEYLGVFQRLVVPVARRFRPQMILVSCGFDAHAHDPLASMELTGAGFLAMTLVLRALADEMCGGRMLFVLEGGYAPTGLYEGMRAVLQGLFEPSPQTLPVAELLPGSALRSIVDSVVAVHGARTPGLGSPS